MKEYKIRVSHISSRVTEELLQKTFAKCGEVAGIVLEGSKATVVRIFLGQA